MGVRECRPPAIALTIAGSDPSGGAGLQADLKTFHQFGVYGTTVVTLITVQNTVRTSRVEILDAGLVGEQIDAILEDLPPGAVKTGALGTAAIVEAVAGRNFDCPLVIDPVMIGKHRAHLMDADARSALRRLLLPQASLVTPNLDEAAELAGIEVRDSDSMRNAARRIADFGVPSVLIKGGHLVGDPVDILWHGGVFSGSIPLTDWRRAAHARHRMCLFNRDHGGSGSAAFPSQMRLTRRRDSFMRRFVLRRDWARVPARFNFWTDSAIIVFPAYDQSSKTFPVAAPDR